MGVFKNLLNKLPEARTLAAAILRSSRIFRDDEGNILIVCKYPYHAMKLQSYKPEIISIMNQVFGEYSRYIQIISIINQEE